MKFSAPQTSSCILVTLMVFTLVGCGGTGVILGGEALGMYMTKPSDPPPADTADQMAAHENWCYVTLAEPQCFSSPQDVPPTRLINVDPPNRYPMNVRAYNEDLAQSK